MRITSSPGVHQGLDRSEDAFGGAYGDDDLGQGIEGAVEERAVDLGERLDQARVSGAPGILVEVGGDRLLGGQLHKIRRREIWESLVPG